MTSFVCKITQQGGNPPVWWRCHIPSGISFSSLSILLDLLLGLEGDGDFSFDVYRTARVWEPDINNPLKATWDKSAYDAAYTAVDHLLSAGKPVYYRRKDQNYQIKVESVEEPYQLSYPLVLKSRGGTDTLTLIKRLQDGILLEDRELVRPRSKAQMLAQAKKGVVRLPGISRDLIRREMYFQPSSSMLIRETSEKLYDLLQTMKQMSADGTAAGEKEPPERYSLLEILRFYDRPDLDEFAEKYGLPVHKKESKEDLANRLKEELLKPDILNRTFLSLKDEETEAFELLVQAGGMLRLEGEIRKKEKHYYALESVGYVFHTDQEILFAGTDVIEAYQKISTPEFHERRRKVSYLLQCLQRIVPYYYVILPVRKFSRIARRKKDPVIMAKEIEELLPQVADTLHDCVIRDGCIYTGQVSRDPKAMEAVRQMQQDKPYYIMTEEEIDEILQYGYPHRRRVYREFQDYLRREMIASEKTAEEATAEAHRLIALSYRVQSFFDMLKKYRMIPTKRQAEEIMKLYSSMVADTHTMYNRGYSPNEMGRIRGDDRMSHNIRLDNAQVEILPE